MEQTSNTENSSNSVKPKLNDGFKHKVFYDLLDTIEKSAEFNKAYISNVSLFISSWKKEYEMIDTRICECGGNKRVADDCTMKPCKFYK